MKTVLTGRSVITVLAVAALVAVIFVVRGPGSGSGQAGSPDTSPESSSLQPTETGTSEATTDEFCAAFEELAQVHAERLANDTPETEAQVDAVGREVLALGAALAVPESIRAGIKWYVGDVIGEPSQATAAEQADFSTFLTTSCPPTY